ncbi:thymidine phosphorylase [Paenibacillaceae bacterium]|nr:thymidine phosphorylase [Paenibacillaceae bacterium]
MNIIDIIIKKKNGKELNSKEIAYVIDGLLEESIPDYQLSALLMAVCFNGMNDNELFNLTSNMINSGEQINLSGIKGVKVDKHSTGGIGDKTSLIISPIVACFNVSMTKMSGRGLGITGGTIDKLESIENFKTEINQDEFFKIVNEVGFSIISQSGTLVPADKKLYSLRDVTGTVDSIPLIASSIMSKKIASGADVILLDVKYGKGAFMKDINEARILAETMINIGQKFNKKTAAVLSNMNEPLGQMIGNKLELFEVMEILNGRGNKLLRDFCVELSYHILKLAGINTSFSEINQLIDNGTVAKKFLHFVKAQGGKQDVLNEKDWYFQAKNKIEVTSDYDGYVDCIDAEQIGKLAMYSGAGRETKGATIDYDSGVQLIKTKGDLVKKGDVLFIIHTNKQLDASVFCNVNNSYSFSKEKIDKEPLISEALSL